MPGGLALQQQGDGLDSLAQAHVISQDDAQSALRHAGQPVEAAPLVGAQFSQQAVRQRANRFWRGGLFAGAARAAIGADSAGEVGGQRLAQEAEELGLSRRQRHPAGGDLAQGVAQLWLAGATQRGQEGGGLGRIKAQPLVAEAHQALAAFKQRLKVGRTNGLVAQGDLPVEVEGRSGIDEIAEALGGGRPVAGHQHWPQFCQTAQLARQDDADAQVAEKRRRLQDESAGFGLGQATAGALR